MLNPDNCSKSESAIVYLICSSKDGSHGTVASTSTLHCIHGDVNTDILPLTQKQTFCVNEPKARSHSAVAKVLHTTLCVSICWRCHFQEFHYGLLYRPLTYVSFQRTIKQWLSEPFNVKFQRSKCNVKFQY